MHLGNKVVHEKPYYFKAAFNRDGIPTVIFRSEHSDDLEISVSEDGRLRLQPAGCETISSNIEKDIESRLTELQAWISADLVAKDHAITALSEAVVGLLVRCEMIQATMVSQQELLANKRRRKSV